MAPTSVPELFSKCHARIARAVQHANEAADLWNSLDIMQLLAVTLFVRDDGTGTLDVDQVEPLPESLELELGEYLYQLRAALDSSVYASAIQDSGQNPPPKPSSIEFPICESKEDGPDNLEKLRSECWPTTVHRGDPTLCRAAARGFSDGLEFESMSEVPQRTSSDRQTPPLTYPHRRDFNGSAPV